MEEKNLNPIDETMEEEILEKLRDASEQVEVPENLEPEAVVAKLRAQSQKKSKRRYLYLGEMAAAMVLVVTLGTIGYHYVLKPEIAGTSGSNNTPIGEKQTSDYVRKEKAGDLYWLASNYQDVYDVIPVMEEDRWSLHDVTDLYGGGKNYVIMEDTVESAESATGTMKQNSTSAAENKDFSTTNLQQQGVDESDVVKTDGKYIYVVDDNSVVIIDITDSEMEKVGTIFPDMNASDTVEEIYVDGSYLYLIAETVDTSLRPDSSSDRYYYDTNYVTKMFTYDISDRENPQEMGVVSVEGCYYTSRKVENYVYLFTTRDVYNLTADCVEEAIPYVQGKLISEDSIYIGKCGGQELVAVSVDCKNPDRVKDQIMILNDYARVYMGNDSIYLYSTDYSSGRWLTQIAKFSYRNGYMDAVEANSVRGEIEDTFAISEKDNVLRVLTTDWTNERVNQLYVFDENMKLTGQINDIAEGESIYAARYIGDMAYFITYRNMDPLFVADLSDPKNPKLLGSLEITGFSDYLHPYAEGKLLGIGYETDLYSNREGGKLVMFDTSDACDPQILGTEVLTRVDEIPGTYEYKQILVDSDKNIIGFMGVEYGEEEPYTYYIYSWDGESFVKELDYPLSEGWNYGESSVRGVYIGETFYIINEDEIYSFDMEENYRELDYLEY